jgi:uncharacterized iron-regulated membrane protein
LTLRSRLLRVHRWAGILLAGFVVLAGLTGSFLAFHHEIDALLAPELHRVPASGARASLDDVARRIEARHPGLVVGYFVFTPDPLASARVVMNTRAAAEAGRLDREAASQLEVFVDPHSGRVLGERRFGEIGLGRERLVPMIYRLHMSLLLGTVGQWITATVALVWLATIVLGHVLAVPRVRVLGQGLAVKWRASRARVFFDLHRAAGLAAGWLLAVIAFTGMYMNLPAGVTEPMVKAFSPFTERPMAVRGPGEPRAAAWAIGWDEALRRARGVEPDNSLAVFGRVESRGYYQLRFMPPDDIVDAGTRRVFVSGRDGAMLGRFNDLEGTAADLFRIWQFPLHSGQGFGMPGRVAICAAGLLPLLLAFTGLWLWRRRVNLRRAVATIP